MPPHRQPIEMEQLISAQAQLAQVMAQFMANRNNNNQNNNNQNNNNENNNNNNNNPPPHVDMLTRFLRLRTPRFSSAAEPILVDDWLRTVNNDLITVGCSDAVQNVSVYVPTYCLDIPREIYGLMRLL